jgi:adenosylmethionine-8-amino-7-oxononanoate aminotransferase
VEHLQSVLEPLRELPGVAEVRQYGLVAGIEFQSEEDAQPARERAREVCHRARAHGVFILAVEGVVMLVPPLTITQPELGMLAGAVEASSRELAGIAP